MESSSFSKSDALKLIVNVPGEKQVLYISINVDRTAIRTGTGWKRRDKQWILTW